MKSQQNRLNRRGLAVVLMLVAGASPQVFARAISPFGDAGGPGGVFGHIDIPEIGHTAPPPYFPGSTDPFTWYIGVDDLDGPKLPPVRMLLPGDLVPPFSGTNGVPSPDLFPPRDGSAGFLPVVSGLEGFAPSSGDASVSLTPVFQVPTPGASMLLGAAAGLVAGRRRRNRHK